MALPESHWPTLHSTNPIERLNKEVKRRADVVGIFRSEASITRLVCAILLEQSDEWQLQRRYMTLETMAGRSFTSGCPARDRFAPFAVPAGRPADRPRQIPDAGRERRSDHDADPRAMGSPSIDTTMGRDDIMRVSDQTAVVHRRREAAS